MSVLSAIAARLNNAIQTRFGVRVQRAPAVSRGLDPIAQLRSVVRDRDAVAFDVQLDRLLRESFSYRDGEERLAYTLTIAELYRQIAGIPGHVVELGVYRGLTAMLFGHLIALHRQSAFRHYFGFDTFTSFVGGDLTDDPDTVPLLGNFTDTSAEYVASVAAANRFGHVHFERGDVKETLPPFLEAKHDFKIALLYVDLDILEPTRVALELLLPRMQSEGLIAFDEYNHWPEMQGETRAVDEVLSRWGLSLRVLDPPFSPSAYCQIPSDWPPGPAASQPSLAA
jgi:hypothetical protein